MNNLVSEKNANIVFDIIIAELDVERQQLTNDADLERDLGADSLDIVQITMAVEESFGITIPDDVTGKVRTVGDLFELLAELLPQESQPR